MHLIHLPNKHDRNIQDACLQMGQAAGVNTGGMAGMLEYQAAYNAAFQAALQQQAAAMLQQGQAPPNPLSGLGHFGGGNANFNPQLSAHLANPAFFANPSVTNAAAAAAASAVQNLIAGGVLCSCLLYFCAVRAAVRKLLQAGDLPATDLIEVAS